MGEVRPPPLQARELLRSLVRNGVEFVVIGGVAANVWGSPQLTFDLDVCPSTTRENLRRLAIALPELGAKLRPAGLEEGVEIAFDERSFDAFTSMALTTTSGWLDLVFRPDGTRGYDDIVSNAREFELGGVRVKVAALDDIIRSKQAAGREKDLRELPLLRELRRRI